jgi:multisubunit Na+/H+ antiporter MnhE subunit
MRTSHRFLLLIFILSIISAMVDVALVSAAKQPLLDIASLFVTSILLFGWCHFHAEEKHVKAPRAGKFLVGFCAPVGLPYYFFSTMSARHAVIACFRAVGFFVVTLVAVVVAAHLTDLYVRS